MKYSFILLAGGSGTRMQKSTPKQYLLLAGKPMIMHILERIDPLDEIDEVVVVCESSYKETIELMVRQYDIKTHLVYANAGKTRQESVRAGLHKSKNDKIIIHESARPFVSENDFKQLIELPYNNVILGQSIPFTVIKGHDAVEGILDRSELINVQLPHKYDKKLLAEAHNKAAHENKIFTEDASLLYYFDPTIDIKIMRGPEYNIKVTTPMDLIIGEAIYKEYFSGRK